MALSPRPSISSPLPQLTGVTYAHSQPAALPDEQAGVAGTNLDADSVQVRLSHPQLDSPLVVNASSHTATEVDFLVPLDGPAADDVPAGWWTLALILSVAGQPDRITNEVPFAVAPAITSPMPMTVTRDASGTAAVALTFGPRLRRGQRIALLLGSREVAAPPQPPDMTTVDQLTFTVTAAEPGRYLTRLRVGGVDSRAVDRTTTPPVFVDAQAVTVTP